MPDISIVSLSYLEYYHMESMKKQGAYSDELSVQKQSEIIEKLKLKRGNREDDDVALKTSDLQYFALK